MRAWLLGGLIGLWPAAVPAQPAPGAATPLFNGKDLSGWVNINCAPDTFTVKDGVIHSTGAPICEIRTERMYENFVLDVEWMHLKPKGNAGVFIWSDALPARGRPFLRAGEVFGDVAIFTGAPYPGTVTALEPVEAWAIDQERMLCLVTNYPELALAVIRRLSGPWSFAR